jgi:hypothetical protein
MSRLRCIPGDAWAIPADRGGARGAFRGPNERVLGGNAEHPRSTQNHHSAQCRRPAKSHGALLEHVAARSTHPKTVITGLVPVISTNKARRCAERVLKCRALSIEMAGTGPAMTIPRERNAL